MGRGLQRRVGGEAQAVDVANRVHRGRVDAIRRVGKAGQDLEGACEVDLVELVEKQRADLEMLVGSGHDGTFAFETSRTFSRERWKFLDKQGLQEDRLALMPIVPPIQPTSLVVEILVFAHVQLLDLAGPLQVFATANQLLGGAEPLYVTKVVARADGLVTASAGLASLTAPLSEPGTPVHTLLVAGGPGVDAASRDEALVRWLGQRARQADRVASVCTGAFLLAETGLLDGRRAVTHWHRCAEFARRFPAVTLEADPIFIQDGTVWTSAGVTAGIDLALAFVEADAGRPLALAVARHLVVYLKRPGGQSQFSAALMLQSGDDAFAASHRFIEANLDGDLSVAVLAAEAGMSERSFARHYKAKIGVTPAQAVERMRVDAARRLLCETTWPIKRIANRCGFGAEETMRRSFLRQLAINPQDCRRRFAA